MRKRPKCIHCEGTGREPYGSRIIWEMLEAERQRAVEIGARLHAAREAKGISRTEMARTLEMSPAWLHGIEKGDSRWHGRKVRRYLDLMGVQA